jgi:hypothetical protein
MYWSIMPTGTRRSFARRAGKLGQLESTDLRPRNSASAADTSSAADELSPSPGAPSRGSAG